MTLGQLRKITEHYDDECVVMVSRATYTDVARDAEIAERVLISIMPEADDEENRWPEIIVF